MLNYNDKKCAISTLYSVYFMAMHTFNFIMTEIIVCKAIKNVPSYQCLMCSFLYIIRRSINRNRTSIVRKAAYLSSSFILSTTADVLL